MGNVQKVQRGDCAWTMAKRNLKAENKKITNAAIVGEINRLAKLNGCSSTDDFSKKFFTSTGREVKIKEDKKPATPVAKKDTVPGKNPYNPPITAKQDTTAPKNPKTPIDTIPAPVQKSKPSTPVTQEKNFLTRALDKIGEIFATTTKKVQKTAEELKKEEAQRINGMASNQQRVIEYNKTNYNGKYYGIVDKKNCKLTIYDKEGKEVRHFTVGVGQQKGDNLCGDTRKTNGRYTTAGEFTLDEFNSYDYSNQKNDYRGRKDNNLKLMALKGDNKGDNVQMAIHMCYKPEYNSRSKAIRSEGLADNRMSYGCVNLLEEDFDIMHSYLGEGNKIFVLPEEEGNELKLEKQKDGTYKFEQTYHRNDKRYKSKEEASKLSY